MTPALNTLNTVRREQALAAIAPLVERSPWVAEAAVDLRPFASDEALAEALVEVILTASPEQQLALFNVHPELSGTEATEGRMTAESTSEQGRLGLIGLPGYEARRLEALNAAYRACFGHPFIIALHRVPDRATLFTIFERRLKATHLEEHTTTLAEIASVIRSRCRNAFGAADQTTRNDPSTSLPETETQENSQ
ncbi:2-oxo-4-hydroxy-4-carboxy-5-ureidoimidazoline decarboxylase [Sagittula sp. MA-2]|jgi:OHCU decarboxylase|uniref:2-oxo-4-hydroxy-4-carboxy-5-ureidoimidazoline decarboxylase n=1 Tax=Sagittula sp. MA-2 TaxID=3048007 RepID=UPI0024C2BFD1|nr:2-oxo-4-hydroxy-4-carboxy-5-ureidoimidazoline decarboxylase [Sagittula sp. MA-2]WHZ34268.1 2-oxo-4-hydroxy-4-carboxy-5-ureidoimidazoline decarboxylase [Sagittula sp. MA-2]